MALMYPRRYAEDTTSAAERKLFDVFRTELSDDWSVVHSLGIGAHDRKPWAEIDFVLIGPPCVFCLEIKGGRVTRRDGMWYFTDRNGRTSAKREGPFEQVGSASSALKDHILRALPAFRDIAVGYGVAMPDIVFTNEGPDVVPEVLYDLRDVGRPFKDYVDRLTAYWYKRLENQRRRPVVGLSVHDCNTLLDLIRGDFDLVPSIHTRVKHASADLLRLTNEQYRVLDALADNERVVIQGAAGTGKTLLAVEEARRRAGRGLKVLYCCYNKNLARFLRLAVAGIPGLDVYHIHGLMASLVAEAGLSWRLPPADDPTLFTAAYPKLTEEALLLTNQLGMYDVLVVDEAQDLLQDAYLVVLDALLKGGLKNGNWRVFLDPNQDIFGGTSPSALQRILDQRPAQYKLSVNCRNTHPIAVNTSLLSGVVCDSAFVVEGPDVDIRWYKDEAQELRELTKLVNQLLSSGVRPADILLMAQRRRENTCLRHDISGVPYRIVDYDPEAALSHRALPFATIGSFKGLESDYIIMVDVDNLAGSETLSNMYVGTSRACAYLALFIRDDQKTAYEQRAVAFGFRLADGGKI